MMGNTPNISMMGDTPNYVGYSHSPTSSSDDQRNEELLQGQRIQEIIDMVRGSMRQMFAAGTYGDAAGSAHTEHRSECTQRGNCASVPDWACCCQAGGSSAPTLHAQLALRCEDCIIGGAWVTLLFRIAGDGFEAVLPIVYVF